MCRTRAVRHGEPLILAALKEGPRRTVSSGWTGICTQSNLEEARPPRGHGEYANLCDPLIAQSLCLITERRVHELARLAQDPPVPVLFAAFQTPEDLHLVTTYSPYGSLAQRAVPMSTAEVGWWARQMVRGIAWLHGNRYVHRSVCFKRAWYSGTLKIKRHQAAQFPRHCFLAALAHRLRLRNRAG